MAHIIPTIPQSQAAPVLTAYWNTESKAYAIAFIPMTESADKLDNTLHVQSWCQIMDYLGDESINLRLVRKNFTHSCFREQYMKSPLLQCRMSANVNRITYNFIQRIMNPQDHFIYSNRVVHLGRSLTTDQFKAFQTKFLNAQYLPSVTYGGTTLYSDNRIDPNFSFSKLQKVTYSFYDQDNFFAAIPNIIDITFENPNRKPVARENWDHIFNNLAENSLPRLKSIEFAFSTAYGHFSTEGLKKLIKSAPNLAGITLANQTYKGPEGRIFYRDLVNLLKDYPQITLRDITDDLQ